MLGTGHRTRSGSRIGVSGMLRTGHSTHLGVVLGFGMLLVVTYRPLATLQKHNSLTSRPSSN